jgi:hypothetical protein
MKPQNGGRNSAVVVSSGLTVPWLDPLDEKLSQYCWLIIIIVSRVMLVLTYRHKLGKVFQADGLWLKLNFLEISVKFFSENRHITTILVIFTLINILAFPCVIVNILLLLIVI